MANNNQPGQNHRLGKKINQAQEEFLKSMGSQSQLDGLDDEQAGKLADCLQDLLVGVAEAIKDGGRWETFSIGVYGGRVIFAMRKQEGKNPVFLREYSDDHNPFTDG